MQVRPATLADRDRVIEIALACDPEDWLPENYEGVLQGANSGLLVAEQESQVIGCFAYEWHPDRRQAYMMGMRIDPAVQGKGLGSAFCKAQIDWLVAAGAERLTLLSEASNERAHRMVQRNGFVNARPWQVIFLPLDFLADEPAAPQTDDPAIRHWWGERAAGQYASLPDSAWIIYQLTAAEFATAPMLHLGAEGALLWGRDDQGEWVIRWLDGAPGALRTLLATFAQMARAGGAERIALSLPGELAPRLAEAGVELPDAWRAYLFVYTA